jgi:LuxR family maltose regulon positive regulatory protein
MAEETQVAAAAGRSHIIKRPRLTRLLDESTSRIVLLVAPAGYGKTTLAREWLENRPHAWYRGTPASADVAALALGLADAITPLLAGGGRRMRDRLKASEAPSRDVDVLADLLSEDFSGWPADAWMAVDDYHFLEGTREAEHFLELIIERSAARFLLTTRTRPAWVTARNLLYGEVFELGRAPLAMSQDEGEQVLSRRRSDEVPGLLALAEGWPAVLSLAAAAGELDLPDQSVPTTLYDFFAEELFQPLPADLQANLATLAFAPVVTLELASLLFGDSATSVLAEAVRLGVLRPESGETFDLHPLLRDFLTRKLSGLAGDYRRSTLELVGRFLIRTRRWDDAFALIERFSARTLLLELVEDAMQTLLADGRLSTLRRWLQFAAELGEASPVLDLAEAEVAFRESAHAQAQALALHARKQLGERHPLASRALALAGESAYQLDQSQVSLDLHEQAFEFAVTESDRRRAAWGQFLAAIQLESDRAHDLLESVAAAYGDTVDGALRLATARLLLSATNERIEDAVNAVRPALFLVPKSQDAKIRTSFLHLFGSALAATANYGEALEMVERGKRDAEDYRLAFTLPFSLLVETNARLGLRDFPEATVLLDQCSSLASESKDVFLDMSTRTATCKMLIAHGAFDEAVTVTDGDWTHSPGPVVLGELLGVRALALACGSRDDEALQAANRAARLTRGVEAHTLAACARAIVSCGKIPQDTARVELAFATATRTENFDSLIAALRGAPPLLASGVASEHNRRLLAKILARSRDHALADAAGFAIPPDRNVAKQRLSPREHEVFTLLLQGRTNRDIATALYLSEATVKVHVRHILRKLEVRSRTQAVLKGLGTEPY